MDTPAVIFRSQQLSFRELESRSNQLAHHLSRLGIKPRTMVPIMVSRGINMIVGLLGIMKAGCAYVPIDGSFPAERVDFILKDINAGMIILDDTVADLFRGNNRVSVTVNMDADADKIAQENVERLLVDISPSDLAYVIYTSGSTGTPKGVMVEHRNLASLTHNLTQRWGMRKGMRIGAMGPYTFDLSVLELVCVLAIGITIVLIDETDPAVIWRQLEEHQVNVVQLTPSRLNLLTYAETDLSPLRRLEILMVGGEHLQERTFRRLKEELKEVRIYNVYGPTEATVWSSSLAIHESEILGIGTPLLYERLYITDDQGNLLPVGLTGEICIGGSGVARGYLNKAELTAEKFVPDRFGRKPGARLYRTGDIGKQMADGTFVFLGRKDDQVKIRGYRIEIGEVENALLRVTGIEHAAVKCVTDKGGNNLLVGYYVSQQELSNQDIIAQLKDVLPSYMVPSVLTKLSAIPLNNNGKIDRKALPDLKDHHNSERRYVAPENELEERLVAIWKDLLGIEQIGTADNFFEIGGHSLLVVDLIARIKKAFSVEISLPMIFQLKNIAAIAAYMEISATAANVPVEEAAYDIYDL